jgi:hypothetical protein
LAPDLFRWEMLEWIDLTGNQWHCDCQLLGVLPSALRRMKRIGGIAAARCASPEQMSGRELVNAVSLFVVLLRISVFICGFSALTHARTAIKPDCTCHRFLTVPLFNILYPQMFSEIHDMFSFR